jgi:hypothetical protein
MKKFLLILIISIIVNINIHAQMYSIKTGVIPFVNLENKKEKDERVAPEITNSLFRYKFISLVERANMDKSIKEMELGQSGLIDEKTAVEVGKIHGIQLIIMGTIQKDTVNARAVHVETQKIVSAVSGRINDIDTISRKLAAGIETYLARENLKKLRNDSADIDLDFRIEKKNAYKN